MTTPQATHSVGFLGVTTTARAPGVTIAFTDGQQPDVGHRTWNQVARLGEFLGHPQGSFSFTPEVFKRLIENHQDTANGEVPVDYEHASETLPDGYERGGVPAVAWIKQLEQRPDADGKPSLWGEFEWVDPQAVADVRAGKYRYLSPAVQFNAKHRETGEAIGPRLTSAALTNHPFLDGLAPLTATARTLSEADLDAVVRAVQARLPHDAHRLGLAPGDVHIPTGTREKKPMEKLSKKLREKLGLSDDAGEDAMVAAFEKLCGDHDALSEADKKRKMAESAECADRAIRDYGLPATARDVLTSQCMASRTAFDAVYPPKPAAPVAPVVSATERAVLQSRVVHTASAGVAPGQIASKSTEDEDHELAEKLMSENPRQFPTYEAAIMAASDRNNKRRADEFVAAFRGAR